MTNTTNDRSAETIYGLAVASYVFAHCAIWPDRTIVRPIRERAINNICNYLETCADLDAGVETLYKNVLLVVANMKQWVNRHPNTFVMLLDDETAGWRIMKLKYLRSLHRKVRKVNSLARLIADAHLAFMAEPTDEMVYSFTEEMRDMGKEAWARRYEAAIAEQRRIFGVNAFAAFRLQPKAVNNLPEPAPAHA